MPTATAADDALGGVIEGHQERSASTIKLIQTVPLRGSISGGHRHPFRFSAFVFVRRTTERIILMEKTHLADVVTSRLHHQLYVGA